jgi:inhibitor of KinA sporulation pathway (predicted exonuclease)
VIKLDQILVIDIEATCWNGYHPEDQESEIIEIGICVINIHDGKRLNKESLFVKPERSTISPFCTELTTITPELVAEVGVSFSTACWKLRKKFNSKQRTWASYGDYDRRIFERQCTARGIRYPFNTSHINIKNLFAVMMGLKQEVGLEDALTILKIPFEGTHHRGVDDAWNAALILGHLIQLMRPSNGKE